MYSTQIDHFINYEKVFERCGRLLEFFALKIRATLQRKKDDDETLTYFIKSINKVATVLDIGSHSDEYLFFVLKIAKRAGRLIAFENEPTTYNYFQQKQEILKLRNVDIVQLAFSALTEKSLLATGPGRRKEATVIDFRTKINREVEAGVAAPTIDKYCIAHNIKPNFLKIAGEGNELTILNGAIEILKRYRPTILIQCEERLEGREKILQTFKFLTDLKYSGYFILDTMKIPLINFDFNIYQNPLSDFYCKDFIFE